MGRKTRFLQLSLTTMLEYNIENKSIEDKESFDYIFTNLLDGHNSVMFPCSYETKLNTDTGKYQKCIDKEFTSLCTLNHLAVPKDSKDTDWYTFLDPDFKYNTEENTGIELDPTDNKVKSYLEFCKYNDNGSNINFLTNSLNDSRYYPKLDTARLYFSTGYDFSDIFGLLLRIYIERNDGKFQDLCNVFLTKSCAYRYIKPIMKPIIFGNTIYDRYIDFDFISSKVCSDPNVNQALKNLLDIKENAPVKLMFSYIENHTKEIKNLEYNLNNNIIEDDIVIDNVVCNFTRTESIKGVIPTEKLNSDNIGIYMSISQDMPIIEFYGTWKDEPLTTEIVNKFNKSIPLYDTSLIKKSTTAYEVDNNYTVEGIKTWVAQHELECKILKEVDDDVVVLKTETFSQSQMFLKTPYEVSHFYYRPLIMDPTVIENLGSCVMSITYTLRLMNIADSVQILKSGSLSVYGNDLNKFCPSVTTINVNNNQTYKVFNKIVDKTQSIPQNVNNIVKTKYVKTFYNTSNIFIDIDGNAENNGEYVLKLSRAPKNYKFSFKQEDINGNKNRLDLSDSYYKLYTRDKNKNEIVIEPTYSSNMNLIFGELEFTINNSHIIKLKELPVEDRVLSVIVMNPDNSITSMFDMRFDFI